MWPRIQVCTAARRGWFASDTFSSKNPLQLARNFLGCTSSYVYIENLIVIFFCQEVFGYIVKNSVLITMILEYCVLITLNNMCLGIKYFKP
jgi:hypothetical protein